MSAKLPKPPPRPPKPPPPPQPGLLHVLPTRRLATTSKMRLEGIVSKRLGSRYVSGRSKDWLKFKNPDAPAMKREAVEDWAEEGAFCGSNFPSRLPRLLFVRVSVGVGHLANWFVRRPLITLGMRLVLLRGVGRTPNIGGVLP
jgi:hypothetical protein